MGLTAGVPDTPGTAGVPAADGTATVPCAPGVSGADTAGVGAAVPGSATVKVEVLEYRSSGWAKGRFRQQPGRVPYEIVADHVILPVLSLWKSYIPLPEK